MLKQDKIILRPLHDNDKVSIARLLNNKRIWDNLRDFVPFPYTPEDASRFIEIKKSESPPATFAIESEDSFCGIIALAGQTDVYKKTAEIGYWIGEPYWNKGIATVAVNLITAYGFEELGFVRIHTGIFEYNIASMRVLEKNGYKKEAVFEKAVFKNGKIWAEHRYARIR